MGSPVRNPQRLPRMMTAIVNGTGTAAIREGSSEFSLVDNGTGDYTLTCLLPFARKPIVVVTCATTDCYAELVDADNTVSVIHILTKINADTATDAVFHVLVMGYDTADIL